MRCFEDLVLGERRQSRSRSVSEAEILAFARQFDPQWFHADAEAAQASAFRGLIASGIQVAALWRQLDHEINGDIAFVCGLGWESVRWAHPVRPGDSVHVTSEVQLLRATSKPDRGLAHYRCAVVNQHGAEALHFISLNLVYRRGHLPPAASG